MLHALTIYAICEVTQYINETNKHPTIRQRQFPTLLPLLLLNCCNLSIESNATWWWSGSATKSTKSAGQSDNSPLTGGEHETTTWSSRYLVPNKSAKGMEWYQAICARVVTMGTVYVTMGVTPIHINQASIHQSHEPAWSEWSKVGSGIPNTTYWLPWGCGSKIGSTVGICLCHWEDFQLLYPRNRNRIDFFRFNWLDTPGIEKRRIHKKYPDVVWAENYPFLWLFQLWISFIWQCGPVAYIGKVRSRVTPDPHFCFRP